MCKNFRFRRAFDKEHGQRFQTLLNSQREHFCYIYWSVCRKLCWKKSFLAISKILGLFVNSLTANKKYSLLNRNNLTQPIQMHLSKKKNQFSLIFPIFFKFKWNFEDFETKDGPHS